MDARGPLDQTLTLLVALGLPQAAAESHVAQAMELCREHFAAREGAAVEEAGPEAEPGLAAEDAGPEEPAEEDAVDPEVARAMDAVRSLVDQGLPVIGAVPSPTRFRPAKQPLEAMKDDAQAGVSPHLLEQEAALRRARPGWGLTHLARRQVERCGITDVEAVDLAVQAQSDSRVDRTFPGAGRPGNTASNAFVEIDGVAHVLLTDYQATTIISCVKQVAPREDYSIRQVRLEEGGASFDGDDQEGRPAKTLGEAMYGPLPQQVRSGSKKPGTSSGSVGFSSTRELLDAARRHGFSYEKRKGGHILLLHPDHPGLKHVIPSTPSDVRSLPNAVAAIKGAFGIDVSKPA